MGISSFILEDGLLRERQRAVGGPPPAQGGSALYDSSPLQRDILIMCIKLSSPVYERPGKVIGLKASRADLMAPFFLLVAQIGEADKLDETPNEAEGWVACFIRPPRGRGAVF